MEDTMHMKQLLADLQVLMTFGFLAGLAICGGVALIAAIIGALRTAAHGKVCHETAVGYPVATWALLGGCIVAVVYGGTVLAASFTSPEMTLPPGQEKYFCEVDCHLAYSVTDVTMSKTIGEGASAVTAPGTFYVVTIRTRFDKKTISSHRGDSPLQPPARSITLVDAQGRRYEPSAEPPGRRSADHACAPW
jgi:hypothetical protein